jgi:hypothetical protein
MTGPAPITLADRFMTERKWDEINAVTEETNVSVRRRLASAHRFVFDEDGARRAKELIDRNIDLIKDHEGFARAPFELTWIEVPVWPLQNNDHPAMGGAVGWLIDHGNVYTVFTVPKRPEIVPYVRGAVGLEPICVSLNVHWPLNEQMDYGGVSCGAELEETFRELAKRGEGYFVRTARESSLREAHKAEVLPLKKGSDLNAWRKMCAGSGGGHAANIIGLLLLLNRPDVVRFVEEKPSGRRFVSGKMTPYMAHTVVTVTLDAQEVVRKIGTPAGDSVERRRHEVRGHYVHDRMTHSGSAAGCIHDWAVDPHPDDDPSQPDHWKCGSCGGKRWWRVAHERGNAAIGFVMKDYAVTGESSERWHTFPTASDSMAKATASGQI